MIAFIFAVIFFGLAEWTKSTFVNIMAGLVNISCGAYLIGTGTVWIYYIIGSAVTALGLYLLIMVGVDLIKGGK